MKKLFLILTAAFLLLLAACTSPSPEAEPSDDYPYTPNPAVAVASPETNTVRVFCWGEYLDEKLNKEFTKQTGLKVIFKTFDTNESLYAALKGGGSSYDVILPSDYMIGRMIEEDMLEPLNFANIPNNADINPNFKNPPYDPENKYSVPYSWGATAVIYNTTKVEGAPDSWDLLFDAKYSGDILMFDNSRDALGIALKKLGYSLNTTNEAELRAAQELLKTQKPILQKYIMDQIFDIMEGGGAAAAPYYAGDCITMMEENPDLKAYIPKEGANKFIDAFAVPKNARNKTGAEMYINFMCTQAAGEANIAVNGYATPLVSVYDNLPDEIKENSLAYPNWDDPKLEVFENLPLKTRDFYDTLWTELKK